MDKKLDLMYEIADLKSEPISKREKYLISFLKETLGKDVHKYLELENIKYAVFVKHLENAYKQGVLDGIKYNQDQG